MTDEEYLEAFMEGAAAARANADEIANGRLRVELPESVWSFAAEFGLTAMLENDLRRAA